MNLYINQSALGELFRNTPRMFAPDGSSGSNVKLVLCPDVSDTDLVIYLRCDVEVFIVLVAMLSRHS